MDLGEDDQLFDGERFRPRGGLDARREWEVLTEDGAECFTAFGEQCSTERCERGRIIGQRLGVRLDRDHLAGDFGGWPETAGRERGDPLHTRHRLDHDGEFGIVPRTHGGPEALPDLTLDGDELPEALAVEREGDH